MRRGFQWLDGKTPTAQQVTAMSVGPGDRGWVLARPASAVGDGDRRPPAKTEGLCRALLGSGDFDDAEGVDQGQVFARPDVPVGAPEGEGMAAGPDDRMRKPLHQPGINVGDQVAE